MYIGNFLLVYKSNMIFRFHKLDNENVIFYVLNGHVKVDNNDIKDKQLGVFKRD